MAKDLTNNQDASDKDNQTDVTDSKTDKNTSASDTGNADKGKTVEELQEELKIVNKRYADSSKEAIKLKEDKDALTQELGDLGGTMDGLQTQLNGLSSMTEEQKEEVKEKMEAEFFKNPSQFVKNIADDAINQFTANQNKQVGSYNSARTKALTDNPTLKSFEKEADSIMIAGGATSYQAALEMAAGRKMPEILESNSAQAREDAIKAISSDSQSFVEGSQRNSRTSSELPDDAKDVAKMFGVPEEDMKESLKNVNKRNEKTRRK